MHYTWSMHGMRLAACCGRFCWFGAQQQRRLWDTERPGHGTPMHLPMQMTASAPSAAVPVAVVRQACRKPSSRTHSL